MDGNTIFLCIPKSEHRILGFSDDRETRPVVQGGTLGRRLARTAWRRASRVIGVGGTTGEEALAYLFRLVETTMVNTNNNKNEVVGGIQYPSVQDDGPIGGSRKNVYYVN